VEFAYNFGLSMLAIAVGILGAFTGLVMTTRLRAVTLTEAVIRIGFAGLGFGGGFWAMHCIAMSAIVAPVQLDHSLAFLALSAFVAMLFSCAALFAVGFEAFGGLTLPGAIVFLGSGLTATHYLGLKGLQPSGAIELWLPGLAGSSLIALEVATIALWFAFRERGVLDTVLASVALGLAVAAMNYLGMEAIAFAPAGAANSVAYASAPNSRLALTVAAGLYGLCGFCFLLFCVFTFRRPIASAPAGALRLRLLD
jgi:NO-binding membrane sensor protein with MHYT domain